MEFFSEPTDHSTHCSWKGDASYRHVVVGGETADNAAWFYPAPFDKAENIKDHLAFYSAVTVS